MYRILDEAGDEIRSAAKWFDSRQSGLGSQFLDSVGESLLAVSQSPDNFPRLETLTTRRDIRRALVKRFPYAVIFEMMPDGPVVLAVHHGRRRPNYWLRRHA